MKTCSFFLRSHPAAFYLGAMLLTFGGLAANADGPPRVDVQVVAPPVFAAQNDYTYYPAYNVYYNSQHRNYAYPEGDRWVSRSAPPGVSVDVLRASPSVKMDFHDSPEHHHADVVQKYPKNWTPSHSDAKGGGHDDHGNR